MDLSAAQLQRHSNYPHQESQSLDSMIAADSKSPAAGKQQPEQKKPRPPDDGPQACPRCESTNTKFCYYNNYSLTQPRYFCKACRRYWTKGGTLRNVPVGGGCRKSSKRSSSISHSPSHFLKRAHTQDSSMTSPTAPNPVFAGIGHLQQAYAGGMGFDGFIGNGNFADSDAGVGFLSYPGMGFLQELQYGNGGGGGLMYQGSFGNYDENGAGNSNCVSGVSDDVAAISPFDDVSAVKQEMDQNDAFWWQSEPVRENWNGLTENSAWGLLNTPALL